MNDEKPRTNIMNVHIYVVCIYVLFHILNLNPLHLLHAYLLLLLQCNMRGEVVGCDVMSWLHVSHLSFHLIVMLSIHNVHNTFIIVYSLSYFSLVSAVISSNKKNLMRDDEAQ